jgi:hypothetical protein
MNTSPSPQKQPTNEIQGERIEPKKTGELKRITANYFECVDCKTTFSEERKNNIHLYGTGKALCNGHVITLCPWCMPDSKPWKDGRGI